MTYSIVSCVTSVIVGLLVSLYVCLVYLKQTLFTAGP